MPKIYKVCIKRRHKQQPASSTLAHASSTSVIANADRQRRNAAISSMSSPSHIALTLCVSLIIVYSQERSPSSLAAVTPVVVIKQFDDGSKDKSFPYIVAAGIERYPSKVTKRMGAKKIAKRSKVKPFVKVISYNHLMPTRYALELEGLKGAVTQDTFKEPSQREDAKKQIKQIFEEKYTSGKNKWFFTPLRF
ncbi:hypothetical protein PHSY_000519 [Pseudozyma hubeiensis SY62]|uniref:60S ribosomal protein L27 n=1 Tax=Pseudozyma hubeiensis (strain SY62) TaxID=1305764 RepID=R9NWP2_PSEHS|nr:hypothetical protein PHSY_000519 [Pseudozyma hubeiensis SY62]GAC92959.1 hypothetical protein PHSY_000519 [Pseudozyma hubeiensis SY62]